MSGHNKWSKIKRKKEVGDAKKSQVFGKLARLITVEAKKAGAAESAGLRAAIEKARSFNMPSDNIDRAVQKGRSDTGASMESVLYEAYGPGGTALLIAGLTDNRNRTAQEVKQVLSKHNIPLATPGSAQWAFVQHGTEWEATSTVPLSNTDALTLESIIEELESHDDVQDVYTNAQ